MQTEAVVIQLKLVSEDLCKDGEYRYTHVHTALTNQKLGTVVRFKSREGFWLYGIRPFQRCSFASRDEAILSILNRHGMGFFDPKPIEHGGN